MLTRHVLMLSMVGIFVLSASLPALPGGGVVTGGQTSVTGSPIQPATGEREILAANPARPPAQTTRDFHFLCMAHCKGPLFRCNQFCTLFNR